MKINIWSASIPLAMAWLASALDLAHAGGFSLFA